MVLPLHSLGVSHWIRHVPAAQPPSHTAGQPDPVGGATGPQPPPPSAPPVPPVPPVEPPVPPVAPPVAPVPPVALVAPEPLAPEAPAVAPVPEAPPMPPPPEAPPPATAPTPAVPAPDPPSTLGALSGNTLHALASSHKARGPSRTSARLSRHAHCCRRHVVHAARSFAFTHEASVFDSPAERELALAKLEEAVLGSAPTQLGPFEGWAKLGRLGRVFRDRDSSSTGEDAAKSPSLLTAYCARSVSSASPRKLIVSRHGGFGFRSVIFGKRCSSRSNAICASSRASGAPTQ